MIYWRSVIIVELWRPEVARPENFVSNFCSFFKLIPFKLWLLLCGSLSKSARASPHIWLTLFQISSKSVHFWQSYCRTCEDRFCFVEYLQYRLFEPIVMVRLLDLRCHGLLDGHWTSLVWHGWTTWWISVFTHSALKRILCQEYLLQVISN